MIQGFANGNESGLEVKLGERKMFCLRWAPTRSAEKSAGRGFLRGIGYVFLQSISDSSFMTIDCGNRSMKSVRGRFC